MNVLLFSGLLWGLLGANPDNASYAASMPGDLGYATYDCCAPCGDSSGDSCGDTCGDPCGTPCTRGACRDRTPCGPLSVVFSIFDRNTWCGPSCGERYWGDFYSDPPDCQDPCDRCGNYTGRTSYGGNWGNVRGSSSALRGGSSGGCNCGKHQDLGDEPIPMEGRVHPQSTRVVSRQSSVSKQPIKAVRPR
jgi:hypothetical protein